MNNPEVFELLAYMATSAAGLKGEPKIYGPLRLIESCQKLVSIILQEDADNENLKELIWIGFFGVIAGLCYLASGRDEAVRLVVFVAAFQDVDVKKALKLVL